VAKYLDKVTTVTPASITVALIATITTMKGIPVDGLFDIASVTPHLEPDRIYMAQRQSQN
jgi:hypothetical protein